MKKKKLLKGYYMPKYSTKFSVKIWNEENQINIFTNHFLKKLAKWYIELLKDIHKIVPMDFQLITIKPASDSRLEMIFKSEKLDEIDFNMEFIMDVDDDCNYPISYYKKEYIVQGNCNEAIENIQEL